MHIRFFNKGSLYSWGSNAEIVQPISEDDVFNSKLYKFDDCIEITPIKLIFL